MTLSEDGVDVTRKSFFDGRSLTFRREDFLVGGRLPFPAS